MFSKRVDWLSSVAAGQGREAFSGSQSFTTLTATSRLSMAVSRHIQLYAQYVAYRSDVPRDRPHCSYHPAWIDNSSRSGERVYSRLQKGEAGQVIPGRQYTLDVLGQIAWRHKWLIVLPALLVGAYRRRSSKGCQICTF
jgi:hypothetical protein